MGVAALGVSGRLEGTTFTPPIDKGNKQDQQMSVIGFIKCPLQGAATVIVVINNENAQTSMDKIRLNNIAIFLNCKFHNF